MIHSAAEPLPQLSQALLALQETLNRFALQENFLDVLREAFGAGFSEPQALALRQQWARGDFSGLPAIEVVPGDATGGAWGAYAGDSRTVYLRDDFVNDATASGLLAVLLEEVGHDVDARINTSDSPGDEGELFSALVRGVELSSERLAQLRDQDDALLIERDGIALALETASLRGDRVDVAARSTTPANPAIDASMPTLVKAAADVTPPTVTSVTSTTGNGSYNAGDVIAIQVNFSEAVDVTGIPQLTLETGATDRTVNYTGGSGTSTLTFQYTVQAGDASGDLDYIGSSALALNGGTIRDAAGNDATLTLAAPGTAGSLGANKTIRVDTTPPVITNVSSSAANGTYSEGDTIVIAISINEPTNISGTPRLQLETGATDRVASLTGYTVITNLDGSGSSTLFFLYTVQAGDQSADLDYLGTSAFSLNGGSIRDYAGNDLVLTLAAPGTAGSLGFNKNLVIDAIPPTVVGVSSTTANGTYKAGDVISIQVSFSEAVNVTGTPRLLLETGATDRAVNYATGTGTDTLTFTYTVQAGDSSADLDYLGTLALTLNGGTIRGATGNNAALALPAPGAANSLGANKAIVIDAVGPTVSGVTSSAANGVYNAGDVISVQVSFSEVVNVTGMPQLTLETGATDRVVDYAGGSGSNTLTFNYTVQAGDTSADLDYLGTAALALNGGTIRDAVGNDATLTLPAAGGANSLGANKDIAIDTTGPTVVGVGATTANGAYGVGDVITVQVSFSEVVNVTGMPQLTLETGATDRVVDYTSGSGSNTLTFNYTVQAGDTSADLDYLGTAALALNGGTIRDAAGNDATLTLAAPGGANSLGANKDIAIDTTGPTVVGVGATTANGVYGVGDVITVQVSFSEVVNVTGMPQLTLETGAIDRVVDYAGGSGSNTLTFHYTVQAGDTSADLDYLGTAALALNGGTIRDAVGNDATLTLAAPGAANSLGGNKNIVVDGVAPTVAITSNVATLKAGETATITFAFSEVPAGFAIGSVTTSGGTLAGLAVTADPRVYTATFTPTPNTPAGTASISLAAGSYSDAAGNAGAAGGTPAITFDTLAPTVTITSSVPAVKIGETATITFTFSEVPTGFDAADIVATRGTLTGLTVTADPKVYTAIFTPAPDTAATSASITVANASYGDAAGNAGAAGTTPVLAVDTARPTATIVVGDNSLIAGETGMVTITFSEAVTGLTAADLTVGSGTVTNPVTADGGITWTATLTPPANSVSASNTVVLDNSGIVDLAGNAGAATTVSNPYAVETTRPVFVGATANGTTLVLTYSDASRLDGVNVPAAAAFTVVSGGAANAVTTVSVDAAARTVTLGLTRSIEFAEVVTFAYADPTAGDDAHAIQDAAGNDAASLAATVASNATPDPTPSQPNPATPPGTDSDRDGVPDAQEAMAPPLRTGGLAGDGNGDNLRDALQSSVVSASLPDANRFLTLVADSLRGLPDPDPDQAFVTNFRFPATSGPGLFPTFSFDAAVSNGGQTETFSLFVDAAFQATGFWVQGANGTWTNIATHIETVGDKLRVDFAVTDGGPFDADGLANGSLTVIGQLGLTPLGLSGLAPDVPPDPFWF